MEAVAEQSHGRKGLAGSCNIRKELVTSLVSVHFCTLYKTLYLFKELKLYRFILKNYNLNYDDAVPFFLC